MGKKFNILIVIWISMIIGMSSLGTYAIYKSKKVSLENKEDTLKNIYGEDITILNNSNGVFNLIVKDKNGTEHLVIYDFNATGKEVYRSEE